MPLITDKKIEPRKFSEEEKLELSAMAFEMAKYIPK
jgi:hypothetical protein